MYSQFFMSRNPITCGELKVSVDTLGEPEGRMLCMEHQHNTLSDQQRRILNLSIWWYECKMKKGVGYVARDAGQGCPRTVLELFRRVATYSGDLVKCRGWYFDSMVAIGTADAYLAEELKE